MLHFAIIAITLALFFYTTAVWAERISRRLKNWHVIFFWLGVLSDASGTISMALMSQIYVFDIHGISGPIALALMLFHAIWATIVVYRKDEKLILSFHRFSLVVWLIWLIPYLSGIIIHMLPT